MKKRPQANNTPEPLEDEQIVGLVDAVILGDPKQSAAALLVLLDEIERDEDRPAGETACIAGDRTFALYAENIPALRAAAVKEARARLLKGGDV